MNARSSSVPIPHATDHATGEMLLHGDRRWAQRPQTWRERELAMPWPLNCWTVLPCAWRPTECASAGH